MRVILDAEKKKQIISKTKPLVMLMASLLSSCPVGKFGAVKHFNHMFKPWQHLAICMMMCVSWGDEESY